MCQVHNVHCVTFALPARAPERRCRAAGASWHECCFSSSHQRQPPGRKTTPRDNRKKAWIGQEPPGSPDTALRPDNNENDTPPHTSKRPTPRASGVFFAHAKQQLPMTWALPSRWSRDRTVMESRQGKEGEAARNPVRRLANRTVLSVLVGHRNKCSRPQPHFESPQLRQVMQPSIMTTAAVLQRPQSCAPSGKCGLAKASVWRVRASNCARFSSTSFC
jgi:hypothetical protein